MLVLETEEHAKARGATIYCELAGFGVAHGIDSKVGVGVGVGVGAGAGYWCACLCVGMFVCWNVGTCVNGHVHGGILGV